MVQKRKTKKGVIIGLIAVGFVIALLNIKINSQETVLDVIRYCLAYTAWQKELMVERQSTEKGYYHMAGKHGKYYPLGYPPTESVNRGVFVKQMGFQTEIDSLMKYFNPTDTVFYIEKAFRYTRWSSDNTVILTEKETAYPYQLAVRDIPLMGLNGKKYFEFRYDKSYNQTIEDSIFYRSMIALKNVKNDTIKLKILLRNSEGPFKAVDCGIIKIFDKN